MLTMVFAVGEGRGETLLQQGVVMGAGAEGSQTDATVPAFSAEAAARELDKFYEEMGYLIHPFFNKTLLHWFWSLVYVKSNSIQVKWV